MRKLSISKSCGQEILEVILLGTSATFLDQHLSCSKQWTGTSQVYAVTDPTKGLRIFSHSFSQFCSARDRANSHCEESACMCSPPSWMFPKQNEHKAPSRFNTIITKTWIFHATPSDGCTRLFHLLSHLVFSLSIIHFFLHITKGLFPFLLFLLFQCLEQLFIGYILTFISRCYWTKTTDTLRIWTTELR